LVHIPRQLNRRQTALRHRSACVSVWRWVAFLFTVLSAVSANAQRAETPKLAIDFRGPVGKTRVVGFAKSGHRFFAAGENKVVQWYDVAERGIVPTNVVRWEFSRGALGEINTAVLSTDGQKLLIGGCSLRGAGGDMIVADLRNQTIQGLIRVKSQIVSAAMTQDLSKVVSGDIDGSITLWTFNSGNYVPRKLQSGGGEDQLASGLRNTFNPVHVVNDRFVLYFIPVSETQSTQYQLKAFDLEANAEASVVDQFDSTGTSLASSADGKVVIAGSSHGQLSIRRQGLLSQGEFTEIHSLMGEVKELEHRVRNIAVSPDGEQFVVMGDYDVKEPKRSFLSLFETATAKLLDRIEFAGFESCVTAAFDADGTQLLSHDDNAEQLLLWKLKTADGTEIDHPLSSSASPPVVVNGRGRIFRSARFDKSRSSTDEGYRLALSDSLGRRTQILLGEGSLEEEADEVLADDSLNGPDAFAPGWALRFDEPENDLTTQNLYVVPPSGEKNAYEPIRLALNDQGIFSGAYAYLQDEAGVPFAVAIGTRTIDGIFIYRIPPNLGETPLLIRYFRDHNGLISDLSVSSDQRYLVSCSIDKTVKIWSLEGLSLPIPQSVFGARVILEPDNKVRLRDVIKAGIFYARGLRDGDVVMRATNVSVEEELIEEPGEIFQLLESHPAFGALDIWTERTGTRFEGDEDDVIRLNAGWEPLLTLVSDKAGEWVLFTPEGYFDASIAEGDRLFGWQINQGADRPPRFEPAEHLQKDFEKPEVIQQLLKTGNVPDALVALNRPVAQDMRQDLRSKVLALPKVEILSPADGATVPDTAAVEIQARVTFANAADANMFEIVAGHAGRSLTQTGYSLAGTEATVKWMTQELGETNVISVGAKEKETEISNSYQCKAEATVFSRRRPRSGEARVYMLAFAVDNYLKGQSLKYSVHSVAAFQNDLSSAKGLARDYGSLSKVLTDKAVSWSSVSTTLSEFLKARKETASVDDLIIVVVCGQGVSKSVARGGSTRINGGEEFFFLPYNVDRSDLRQLSEQGIRWKDICDPVNGIECDVLWIVDACHSAQARNEAKSAFSECRGLHGRHVIFADQTEPVEASSYQVRKSDPGNTALLAAIRETLIGSEVNLDVTTAVTDLWRDNSLTFEELTDYSQPRIRQLAKSLGKNQRIVFTPKAPSGHLRPLILGAGDFVPLAR
jgi:WD40 repeat protein